MKQYLIYGLFLLPIGCPDLTAQRVRGAEMELFLAVNLEVTYYITVYREGNPKEEITLFWGDGNEEVIELGSSGLHPSGYRQDYYSAYHTYDSAGLYSVTLRDTFLVEDVINISDSENIYFQFVDSVRVFQYGNPNSYNQGPRFGATQFNVDFEDGLVEIDAYVVFPDPEFHTLIRTLAPFPAPGYTYPEAPGGFHYNVQDELVWDRPQAPGTYAFAFHVREMALNPDTPDPLDSILLSTHTRAMMVDIDSSHIVLTSIPQFPDVVLDVFPNPSTDYLYIQASGFENNPDYQLILSDLQGRVLQEKEGVIFNGRLENQVLDVSDLPAGIYQVLLRFYGYEFMKRVVVE